MRRTTLLLVPLVFAVAAASLTAATVAQPVPADGQSPLVASYGNTSNYLSIPADDVRAADRRAVGLDVGTAVGVDGRDLQAAYRIETFRERFDGATDDRNRTRAFEAAIASLEERTETLQARNDRVIGAYANGSVTAGTLLRERAAIAAEARLLQGAIAEIQTVERSSLNFDMRDRHQERLGDLSGRLQILTGPISERTAQLAAGGGESQSVYVEGSIDGYVFASTDGDTYVRETYLGGEYQPGATDQFEAGDPSPLEQVLQRAGELYPNTTSEGIGGFGETNIYRYNAEYPAGQLTVYLDGGSTNAFREGQRVNASALPVASTESTTNGSATLQVNRTFPTGPMEITLTDARSGAPMDGTVSVDGDVVGRTGSDGSLWAVEPRGGGLIRASTGDTNVTLAASGT